MIVNIDIVDFFWLLLLSRSNVKTIEQARKYNNLIDQFREENTMLIMGKRARIINESSLTSLDLNDFVNEQ